MKKIIAITLLAMPLSVIANDQTGNTYNPNSFTVHRNYITALKVSGNAKSKSF
jgi:hypothetical protein